MRRMALFIWSTCLVLAGLLVALAIYIDRKTT